NKINEELKKYSEKLSTLPQIVVLTKTDLLSEEDLKEKIKNFEVEITKKLTQKPVILTISSITQKGLENLKNVVWNHLEKIPKTPPIEIEEKDFDKRDKTSINIKRKDDASFEVTGGYVDNLIRGIVLSDFNSFSYFQMRLKRDGVIEKLKEMGMKDGDLVRIKDIEFVYED
ncbi:MAG: Obg family GTPase CgtA, partial [Clostridia bacterium]|nr:Obg family GTPase CgtA [Clostridia bacterium]